MNQSRLGPLILDIVYALLLILVTDQRKDSLGLGSQWGGRQKKGVKRGKKQNKKSETAQLALLAVFFLALTIFSAHFPHRGAWSQAKKSLR